MSHPTAAAVMLCALVLVCSGCGGGPSGAPAGASSVAATTTAPGPPPRAVPSARAARVRALNGEPLQVALLGVRDPAAPSDGAPSPHEGRRYVAVELRVSNTGSRLHDDVPADGATLRDTAGGEWSASLEDVVAPGLGALAIAAGETRTGWLTFEVPAGATLTTLRFAADGGFGGAATWRLR